MSQLVYVLEVPVGVAGLEAFISGATLPALVKAEFDPVKDRLRSRKRAEAKSMGTPPEPADPEKLKAFRASKTPTTLSASPSPPPRGTRPGWAE